MPPLLSEETLEQRRPEPQRPAEPEPALGRSAASRRPRAPCRCTSASCAGSPIRSAASSSGRGITYTHQLVEAAARAADRRALAARSGIEVATLERLVCRADLARINGIGAIFADMLELLGVDRIARLARQEPDALHAALAGLNARERLARRAPTPEEVRTGSRRRAPCRR